MRTRDRSRPLVRPVAALLAVAALVLLTAAGPAGPAGAVTGQYWVGKLQLSKVWKITRGAGVTVAVVDSGVPRTGDLGSRLLAGRNVSFGGGRDGRSDPGVGTGAIGGTFSHGEEMAELIAGDGSDGLTGIAPQAKILPVKVLTRTNARGTTSALVSGIRYAVQHGAQVINVSLATYDSCDSDTAAAVKYAYQHDVIVVAGTGDTGASTVGSPANCPGALAVSGIDSDARPWSGSNYGSAVDVTNFATEIPGITSTGGQGPTHGTSAATAFTSGEIALLRAAFPHDSARAIVTRLVYGLDNLTTSLKNGTRVNDHVGYGVPVPLDELKDSVPAGAPNPIYDAFYRQLGSGSGNTGSAHHGGGPATPPSSTTPSSGASSTTPSSGTSPNAASSGGGTSGVVWVGAAALLVVLIGIGVAVSRTRSRLRGQPPQGPGTWPPTTPPPPPPPGYGPPR